MNRLITFPMILVLIGGLLTLAGGLWATYEANKDKLRSSEERNKFEKELRIKSEEIAKLSVYNLNILTGGDSFPFTEPSFNIASLGQMDLWLVNGGMYPLYDVTVTIRDLKKFQALAEEPKLKSNKKTISLNDFETKINVGNMRPAEIKHDFYITPIPEVGELNYRIEISCRNSYVVQMIQIKFTGIRKREILKLETIVNGKVVDHNILYDKITKKN
jgi:hypothetical protein